MKRLNKVMALSLLIAMSTNIYTFAGVVKSNAAKVVRDPSTQEIFEQPVLNESEESQTATTESTVNSTTLQAETAAPEDSTAATIGESPSSSSAGPSGKSTSENTLRHDNSDNYGPGMKLQKKQISMPDGVIVSEVTIREDNKYYQYVWRESGQSPQAKGYIFEPKNFNGKTVFLDAGHGDNASPIVYKKNEKIYPLTDEELTVAGWSKGYGVGSQARTFPNVFNNQEIEPEFALNIALLTRDILLHRGYKVVLSRTAHDQNISNGSRSALAGQTSDIMISIHSNASANRTAHGTVALYPGEKDYLSAKNYPGYLNLFDLSKNQASSKKLSELLVNNLSGQVGFQNLGTAEAVIRLFSYSTIPTSLVEVGFSDNIIDAQLLIEKKPEISKSIADAVDAYFK